MPTRRLSSILTLFLCLAASIAAWGARQSAGTASAGQSAKPGQPDSNESGYVLKVTTRLVTLDLIAVDSHGKAVRDLKPQDLEIFEEHNAQQKIEQLEFVDTSAIVNSPESPAPANSKPAKFYSNRVPVDGLRIAPTVLLLDGLNTQTQNQMQGRKHMVELLKTLPRDTPVAVFLLGTSLRVLQGFTTNKNLLQAAAEHMLTANNVEQDPADDPDSASNALTDLGTDDLTGMISQLQDFEKEQYASTMDLRAQDTIAALTAIGQYLSGIPGRKNLIWVSESFPISILPSTDTGINPFAGTRDYGDQIARAANALTDAQVAVYPVDIRGLQAQQTFSASQPMIRGRMNGPAMAAQMSRGQNALLQSQGTMETLAQETGGKTCKNTNDLSGCVLRTLNNSSAYYELAFYPQNVNWDGAFHKIVIKTSRPGVKLTYRRGYYAFDASSLAKKQSPTDRLNQACSDLLPSTAVHLTAQEVQPGPGVNPLGGLPFLLSITADGLGVTQSGDSRGLNLVLGMCEFGGRNQSFRLYSKDLPKTVPSEVFQRWLAGGIPEFVTVTTAANTRRVRFVILDNSTGLAGALDVPVSAADLEKAAAAAAAPATLPPPPVTLSYLEMPDREPTASPPNAMGALTFHAQNGEAGSLDWNGDVLLYRGEIPVGQSATALFSYAYGNRFHCESGHLLPVDPKGVPPVMRFTFHNHDGKVVTVDLSGGQPDYQGDLPVDASAKSMFDRVWKSSHCQAQ